MTLAICLCAVTMKWPYHALENWWLVGLEEKCLYNLWAYNSQLFCSCRILLRMKEFNLCFFSISQRCIHGNIVQLEIPFQMCNIFHGILFFFCSSEEQSESKGWEGLVQFQTCKLPKAQKCCPIAL